MDIKINPVFDKPAGQPVVIAGPCSAESEEQVLTTARALAKQNIDFALVFGSLVLVPVLLKGLG